MKKFMSLLTVQGVVAALALTAFAQSTSTNNSSPNPNPNPNPPPPGNNVFQNPAQPNNPPPPNSNVFKNGQRTVFPNTPNQNSPRTVFPGQSPAPAQSPGVTGSPSPSGSPINPPGAVKPQQSPRSGHSMGPSSGVDPALFAQQSRYRADLRGYLDTSRSKLDQLAVDLNRKGITDVQQQRLSQAQLLVQRLNQQSVSFGDSMSAQEFAALQSSTQASRQELETLLQQLR